MTYPETIRRLYRLQRFGIKLGLANVGALLAALGEPQRRFRAVHIAGTNGKGSTAAYLEAILRAAGHRTGLYTSPHLLDFSERIRVNGARIPEADVVRLARHLEATVAAGQREGRLATHPTFFEVVTALAFAHFAERGVEVAVIETGMGGRLDATNVVTPLAAVVTNVTLEHQEHLGATVEAIAREKAGIAKPGVPLLTAAREPVVLGVLRAACDAAGSPLIRLEPEYQVETIGGDRSGQAFRALTPRRSVDLRTRLLGRHQLRNALLAIAAAEVLEAQGVAVGDAAIRDGIAAARWPGRLQVAGHEPLVLLDGAHNPGAAQALAAFLAEERRWWDRLVLVFGVLRDKDWRGILAHLGPQAGALIPTRPDSERAADPKALEGAEGFCPRVRVTADLGEALDAARAEAGPRDAILVAGSLFTVASAMRALGWTSVDVDEAP
jgi:dihydrofolate synthase/folylpolyglutamate synthase